MTKSRNSHKKQEEVERVEEERSTASYKSELVELHGMIGDLKTIVADLEAQLVETTVAQEQASETAPGGNKPLEAAVIRSCRGAELGSEERVTERVSSRACSRSEVEFRQELL